MLRQTVLFNGADSNNFGGLWVTNGTAAGTSELTGISGTDTNSMDFGLDPLGFALQWSHREEHGLLRQVLIPGVRAGWSNCPRR